MIFQYNTIAEDHLTFFSFQNNQLLNSDTIKKYHFKLKKNHV